ncbi:toprim domain-containing protein [Gloeobacter kilaueensis]|uniref:DNA primase n=1 Tax=Gloeobacter kilaueensis (strain ATCC BAA-2537 / CCAP 1431/1 / ULC 316 / JS1) TaxID=1183438 RepID=U5QK07_GLOK1|nr:toprim domain-containing protein [Gloeobacter kilaueensis]AGY58000.1 DNA primase [Gloeobacter kilaueensis JS1]
MVRDDELDWCIEAARQVPVLEVAARLGIDIIRSHPRYTQCYCPFHGGDSGVILHDGRRNLFKCHAGCVPRSRGGHQKQAFDAIDLVQQLQNLSFREALDYILGTFPAQGAPTSAIHNRPNRPPPPPSAPEEPIPIERIDELHNRLMLSVEGEQALAYLAARGIERRTALRWRLGLSPRWEGSLGGLCQEVPGLVTILAAFKRKGIDLLHQHRILEHLCLGKLEERQVCWFGKHLDVQMLIERYGHAHHFRSWRISIPVWEDGPPQDGAARCWGLRFRQVPGLTPDLPVHPGCTLIHQQTGIKYQLLEVLADGRFRLRLKRDSAAEAFTADPSTYRQEATKCWGRGTVRTLAANHRHSKRFAIAVEGEIDLLSLDQALLGTPLHGNCWLISSTNGAGNFPAEWSEPDFWKPFSRIFFAYDRDRAGETALRKMRAEGVALDSRPVPHGKDFNDWLLHHSGHIPHDELRIWLSDYTWYAP